MFRDTLGCGGVVMIRDVGEAPFESSPHGKYTKTMRKMGGIRH